MLTCLRTLRPVGHLIVELSFALVMRSDHKTLVLEQTSRGIRCPSGLLVGEGSAVIIKHEGFAALGLDARISDVVCTPRLSNFLIPGLNYRKMK